MCVMSMVHDHFEPFVPTVFDDATWAKWLQPSVDIAELRKIVDEFKQAVAAAKELDVIMKKPDCVDPGKAKLQDRVDFLERKLQSIQDLTKDV